MDDDRTTDEAFSSPQSWSQRSISIAELLLPYRNRQPSVAEYNELRYHLKIHYKGRLVSEQTVRTLINKYRADGVAGLERSRHRDTGSSTLPSLLVQHIRDLLITQRLSLKKVQEKAQEYAREVLELPGSAPSYDQVVYIDKSIPENLKTLGKEGIHAYRNKHEIAEQFEAEYANQLVHWDNHKLDILARNPATKKSYRPWISVGLCDQSRAIVGIHISKRDPGSRGIALAFRHALLPKNDERWIMRGIFDNVYFDHGKDFLSEHITRICLHLGIHIMTHEEYHPQAKGKLEQWFNTLEEDCLSDKEGYVGSKREKRPKDVKAKYTAEEILAMIIDWILTKYHQRIHTETRMTPHKRWVTSMSDRRLKLIDESNERNLDFLLKSQPRTVYKLGIRKANHDYLDDDYKIENFVGHSVDVFYDPLDLSALYVYQHDGTYLCTAYPRGKRIFSDEDRPIVAAAARKRRQPKQAEVKAARQRVASANKAKTGRRSEQERSGGTESPDSNALMPTESAPIPSKPPAQKPALSSRATPVRVMRLDDLLKEFNDGNV